MPAFIAGTAFKVMNLLPIGALVPRHAADGDGVSRRR
jgi:hypothetical protein